MARTQVASDAFTNTDGTLLTSHGAWTQIRDVSYNSGGEIRGNKLAGNYSYASVSDTTTQTHTGVLVRSSGTYSNDQYAKAAVYLSNHNTPERRCGVVVRCGTQTDTNANFYAVYICDNDSGGRTTVLCKVVGGTFTSLYSARVSWSNADTVALEASGTTLTAYKNDVAISGFSVTDGALSGGRPGVYIASYQLDSPNMLLDDWEGGDVSGASGIPKTTKLLMMGIG